MNRRYNLILSSVLSFVCIFACLAMLLHAFNVISFAHGEKIITGITAVISGYTAVCVRAFRCDSKKRRAEMIKNRLFLIFVFYIIMLVDFTLIDDAMGRNIFSVLQYNGMTFSNYLNESTNLIPFATVRLFINGYLNGKLTLFAMLENILGNFVVFMPMPFFLHCLFDRFDKPYKLFTAVLGFVCLVELLQLALRTGAADIDDVILNVSGAMLFYGFIKTEKVSRIITKLTFGVWKTNEKENQS